MSWPSFLDHLFGMDNAFYRPDSSKPVIRPDTDKFGSLGKSHRLMYTDDLSAGVTKFLARVLRVENKGGPKEDESFFGSWFGALVGADDEETTPSNVAITAIIDCDIHAPAWGSSGVGNSDFKLPNDSGDGGSANANKIIDKVRDCYRGLFIASNNLIKEPEINSLVWVTFGDMANRRDGIYMGPVISSEANPRTPNGPSTSRPPCNGLVSAPPNGRAQNTRNALTKSQIQHAQFLKDLNAKIERGQLPVGKGVFTGYPDLETHKINLATEATLNWVCYTGIIQDSDGNVPTAPDLTKIKKFAEAYHKKGIRTYIMGYPSYKHEEKFISEIISLAGEAEAIGVIINLDYYYDKESPADPYESEKYLMTALRDKGKKGGFCIGLTATNLVDKKDTPWKIFSDSKTGVDFVIPQILNQTYNKTRDDKLPPSEDQQGPTQGTPASFDDITPSNFMDVAKDFDLDKIGDAFEGVAPLNLDEWDGNAGGHGPAGNPGFEKVSSEEQKTRTKYMKAAAYIIELYWRQMYPDATVIITDHYRPPPDNGNHSMGAAIDLRIEATLGGSGTKRLSVLRTHSGLKKLQAAGRIPNGGTGVYLNLSPNGIKGVDTATAGSNTQGTGYKAGPGGSAANHYDMRGFLYTSSKHHKNTVWTDGDTVGKGKDDKKGQACLNYLKNNGLGDVADFLGNKPWNSGGWTTDPESPSVGGGVPNMRQVLGLEDMKPSTPQSAGESLFVQQFEAWKNIGFKHIVPALGMIGKSPEPSGWKDDGYDTPEKSPWRIREEATWAFTSVKHALSSTMANSVIWWDWESANTKSSAWPEQRWDIIRELGVAATTAEKINSLKDSNMDDTEKNKIKNFQLARFLRQSPSVAEDQAKKQTPDPPTTGDAPSSVTPSVSPVIDQPTASGLSAAQKKEIETEIDTKTKILKANEEAFEQLKSDLRAGPPDAEAKKGILSAIANKQADITTQIKEISALKAKLAQEKIAGSTTPATPATAATTTPASAAASTDPRCRKPPGNASGAPPKQTVKGTIKESKLEGVEFVDFPFTTYPRKTTSYIVIHTPAGGGDYVKVANKLLSEDLGVHFTVSRDGTSRQHVLMDDAVSHAAPINKDSVGIEVLNASDKGSPMAVFKPGKNVQYEKLYQLVKKIVAATPIPLEFPAVNFDKGTYYFGWNEGRYNGLKPGIVAHGSFQVQTGKQHGDGRFSVLYMALRKNGNSVGTAYKLAVAAHEKQSKKNGGARFLIAEVAGLKTGGANPTSEVASSGTASTPCPAGSTQTGNNADGSPACSTA